MNVVLFSLLYLMACSWQLLAQFKAIHMEMHVFFEHYLKVELIARIIVLFCSCVHILAMYMLRG